MISTYGSVFLQFWLFFIISFDSFTCELFVLVSVLLLRIACTSSKSMCRHSYFSHCVLIAWIKKVLFPFVSFSFRFDFCCFSLFLSSLKLLLLHDSLCPHLHIYLLVALKIPHTVSLYADWSAQLTRTVGSSSSKTKPFDSLSWDRRKRGKMTMFAVKSLKWRSAGREERGRRR